MSTGNPATPPSVLKQAIDAVPAVKYALGVGGIISVIAIIRGFRIDFRVALWGTVVMLLLMTVLLVFAKASSRPQSAFKGPAFILTWFSLVLFMATATALFLSVFFGKPLDLRTLLAPVHAEQTQPLATQRGSLTVRVGASLSAGQFSFDDIYITVWDASSRVVGERHGESGEFEVPYGNYTVNVTNRGATTKQPVTVQSAEVDVDIRAPQRPDVGAIKPPKETPAKRANAHSKNTGIVPVGQLTVSRSERISTDPDAPYEAELVIATTKNLPGLSSVVIHCDGNVVAWSWTSPERNTIKNPARGNSFQFPYSSLRYGLTPQFDPAHPLVFLVWSKRPVTCDKVETF